MEAVKFNLIEDHQIPGVVNVINDAYRFEAFFKKNPTRVTIDEMKGLIKIPASQHWVATVAPDHPWAKEHPSEIVDGILGHVLVEDRDEFGYFGMLAVVKCLHGIGLGSRLLEFAEEKMKDAGKKASMCQVVSPVPRLVEYYSKRGYRLTGETGDWESDNLKFKCWFIYMKKEFTLTNENK